MKFKSALIVVLCALLGAAVGYGLLCYMGWRVYTLAESPVARMAAFTGALFGGCVGWGALVLPSTKGGK